MTLKMRVSSLCCGGCLVMVATAPAFAQETQSAAEVERPSLVAVVHIATVLKEHRRYQSKLEKLRAERAKGLEELAELNREIARLKGLRDDFDAMNGISGALTRAVLRRELDDRDEQRETVLSISRLVDALTFEIGALEYKVERHKKQLEEEQAAQLAAINKAVHAEIMDDITQFSLPRNIVLVVEGIEPSIQQGLSLEESKALFSGDVIYHQNLEITYDIISR